jgi:hypothetical protein
MHSIRLLVLACLLLAVTHIRPVEANSVIPKSVILCTANGQACTSSGACCSDNCDPVTQVCECIDLGETCTRSSQCCSPYVCNVGQGNICYTCGNPGDYCVTSGDCCATAHTCSSATNTCCISNGNFDDGNPGYCCSGYANEDDICQNIFEASKADGH